MIASISKDRLTIKRQSTKAISQAAAASIAVPSSPITSAVIQISISPFEAGTVTITGTKGASSQSETITPKSYSQTVGGALAMKGLGIGVKLFDTVTLLECSGLSSSTTVTMEYRTEDGGAAPFRTNIATCYPASISRGSPSWRNPTSGTEQGEAITVILPFTCTFTPKAGDIFINDDTGEQFLCDGAPIIEGTGVSQYFRCKAHRRENY